MRTPAGFSVAAAAFPPGAASRASASARANLSIPQRKLARVLPDPVGAQISALSPEAIASQPRSWTSVGASKDASNQRLTGSLKSEREVRFGSGLKPPILRRRRTRLRTPGSTRQTARLLARY